MTSRKILRYWWPTLVWAGVIFWFSSRPAIPTSDVYWQDFIVKKTAHIVVYFVLATLLYRSLVHTTRLDKLSLVILTLALTVLYAISDETHQSFIPGREPRFRDIMIDSSAAAVSLWLIDKKRIIKV